MMNYDLVVIGAGLAGMTTALKALQQGQKTIVVAAGAGAMEVMSGCLDICGGDDNPWLALRRLVAEKPAHPYALLSEEEIREALAFFVEQIKGACPYYHQSGFRNFRIPTALGGRRRACLLPEGQLAAATEGPVLAVGFKGWGDFCAELMAEGMNRVGYRWQATEVDTCCLQGGEGDGGRICNNSVEIALRLERSWRLLAEELSGRTRGFAAAAFPAVLGLDQHLTVKRGLEKSLGVSVFEAPALPPSLPGMRLAASLAARIRRGGGDLLQGFPVVSADIQGRMCRRIIVATPGSPLSIGGKNFILASGGILGGGILLERERASEAVFNFPASGFRRQASVFQTGVRVNRRMQPLAADGQVILENVFCAGRILAGYDPFSEGSGAGVAVATGYRAAVEAGRMAEQ